MRFAVAIPVVVVSAVLAAATSGCKKDEVQVYQAPKDGPTTPAAAQPPSEASPARPPWTVPEGWVERPSTNGMRMISYTVNSSDGRSLDISVVPLGPEAGNVLANVNRWRNELRLAPITEADLPNLVKATPIGSTEGHWVDLVSDTPTLDGRYKARLMAGMLSLPNATVFFRMLGEDALAADNRGKFLAWLKSVDIGPEPSTAAPAPPTSPAMTGPVAPPPATSTPQWSPPANWRPAPGSAMRVATFEVAGEGGATGDLSVVALSGGGGGALANVNRWRGQMGQGPVDEAGLAASAKPLTVEGSPEPARLVEIEGTGGHAGSAILAAIVSRAEITWFYKLTGPSALVAREKANFTKFVASVKYP